mmetsp:Transcript_9581/g.31335  ORF Transcript_9581/g.31335 Transcript_9581/m.31335 type:complete len:337 (+) Transcript_9581:256-1266(+)
MPSSGSDGGNAAAASGVATSRATFPASSGMLWLAPCRRSSCTSSGWPPAQTTCSGVCPSFRCASTYAPFPSSAAAMPTCPFSHAACSAVRPVASGTLTRSGCAAARFLIIPTSPSAEPARMYAESSSDGRASLAPSPPPSSLSTRSALFDSTAAASRAIAAAMYPSDLSESGGGASSASCSRSSSAHLRCRREKLHTIAVSRGVSPSRLRMFVFAQPLSSSACSTSSAPSRQARWRAVQPRAGRGRKLTSARASRRAFTVGTESRPAADMSGVEEVCSWPGGKLRATELTLAPAAARSRTVSARPNWQQMCSGVIPSRVVSSRFALAPRSTLTMSS